MHCVKVSQHDFLIHRSTDPWLELFLTTVECLHSMTLKTSAIADAVITNIISLVRVVRP